MQAPMEQNRGRTDPVTHRIMHAMRIRRAEVERLGRIREFIFGTQDGLLSTLGVVTGVTGATSHNYTILVAGLAEAVAGMVAMAAGEFISSRSQAQVYGSEIDSERIEVERFPDEERREVRALFQAEGLSPQDAETVARLISKSEESWLKTMVEKELGLTHTVQEGALTGAIVMGVTFMLGSLVPIAPYLFFPARPALIVSIGLTLAVLFAIGFGKARLAHLNPLVSAFEVLAVGSAAAVIGYLFGTLLPHILHAT